MNQRLSNSGVLQVTGLLLAGTGVALLRVVFLATDTAAGVAILAAAALLLAAGAGLLLRRVWGWYLGVFVAVSGAVMVASRLLTGNDPASPALLVPLVMDLLLLVMLLMQRTRIRIPADPASGGRRGP
jgi:hypothetical protein